MVNPVTCLVARIVWGLLREEGLKRDDLDEVRAAYKYAAYDLVRWLYPEERFSLGR